MGPDEQLESDAEESDTFVDPEGCCGLSWQVPRKVFKPLYGPDVRALIKRQIEAGLLEPTEENDFSEYILIILQDIKNTLKEDAYFIGFLAAVSKYQSRGQVLHAAFIIFILIFAIACQGSMIWFMRWGQLLQSSPIQLPSGLEWSTHHFGPMPKDGDVSSDLNSWILFLGLFGIVHIFFMQVEEEERVYLKVLKNSEWLNKKMTHELHCSTLRTAFVFCLKFAKAVMPILLRIAGIHTLFCSSGNLELVLSCTALMFSSSTLRSLVSKSSFWAFAGYVCSRRTWASTTSKTCECEGKGCRQMLGCDHRRPCPTIIDIIEIRFPLSYCVPMCSPITEIRVRHSLSHGKSKPLLIAHWFLQEGNWWL